MADDLDNNNPFHACALAAGFQALAEGSFHDSEYVRLLAYELYERRLADSNRDRQ